MGINKKWQQNSYLFTKWYFHPPRHLYRVEKFTRIYVSILVCTRTRAHTHTQSPNICISRSIVDTSIYKKKVDDKATSHIFQEALFHQSRSSKYTRVHNTSKVKSQPPDHQGSHSFIVVIFLYIVSHSHISFLSACVTGSPVSSSPVINTPVRQQVMGESPHLHPHHPHGMNICIRSKTPRASDFR